MVSVRWNLVIFAVKSANSYEHSFSLLTFVLAGISVTCDNCGAEFEVSRRVKQFTCDFCETQFLRDGREFIRDVDHGESLLQATTSKLNRVREIRLIRQIRELDAEWESQWPSHYYVATMHLIQRDAGRLHWHVEIV